MAEPKFQRLTISVPAALVERSKVLDNVSACCARAIEAACDVVESGEPQTLVFGFKVTRTLDIQPLGWEAET
jgi:hypothetical protein